MNMSTSIADTEARPQDFRDAGWIGLDDGADADELNAKADDADAQLLGAVACAAFATLALALVSSLPMPPVL